MERAAPSTGRVRPLKRYRMRLDRVQPPKGKTAKRKEPAGLPVRGSTVSGLIVFGKALKMLDEFEHGFGERKRIGGEIAFPG